MKRIVIGAVVLGAALLLTGAAEAQSTDPAGPPANTGRNFVDADGDGVCDNCTGTPRGQGRQGRQGQRARQGGKGQRGPGDGTGNHGVGPRDGSGYGRGAGSGSCNGTGPRGQGRGRRR